MAVRVLEYKRDLNVQPVILPFNSLNINFTTLGKHFIYILTQCTFTYLWFSIGVLYSPLPQELYPSSAS